MNLHTSVLTLTYRKTNLVHVLHNFLIEIIQSITTNSIIKKFTLGYTLSTRIISE